MSTVSKPISPPRLSSLDGLRGLAALIVVFHHLSLTYPAISDMYLDPAVQPPEVGTVTWWLMSTPAHLLIAGPEGVVVFFIISGLALALPVLRSETFDWVAYFPQRMVRLYLPVAGAVAFAAILILLVPGNPETASSSWVAGSSYETIEWYRPIIAFDVLFGDAGINNPLWSLRWEVAFSLALPLFVVIGVLTRRRWLFALAGAWLLVLLGNFSYSISLLYLPVFLLGVVLAVKLDVILAWAGRRSRSSLAALAIGVLLLSAVLLPARWIMWSINPGAETLFHIASSFVVLGALGVVLVAVAWPPASWLLSTPPFRWLGRISFSLYLVHVPIIIAVNAILGGTNLLLGAAISVAVAVPIALLFSRFIETPAHRAARVVGRESSTRFASLRATKEQQTDSASR